MLWLCKISLEHYEYMGDTTTTEVTRIVEADSAKECEEIIKSVYEDEGGFQGDSSTRAYIDECDPVLTKNDIKS